MSEDGEIDFLATRPQYEMLNIDKLGAGTDAFLERVSSAALGENIRFHTLQIYHEPLDASLIRGDAAYIDYVKAAYAKGDSWTELVVEMRNALVHCADSPPFIGPYLPDQKIYLTGSSLNLRDNHIERVDINVATGARIAVQSGVASYHLNGVGYQIYGHWLLDFLPRILLAIRHARSLGCVAHIYMPQPPSYALKILQMLQLDCQFIYFDLKPPFMFDRIYAIPSVKLGLRYASHFVGSAFGVLQPHAVPLQALSQAYGTHILISRRKPPMAKNFADLQALLLNHGFKVIFPEDHPLEEQIAIFNAARVIVGEDGSAMHNVGFCVPGAKVIIAARSTRRNVWHVSVTQYAKVHLSYLASIVEEDGYNIDIAQVERLLCDI